MTVEGHAHDRESDHETFQTLLAENPPQRVVEFVVAGVIQPSDVVEGQALGREAVRERVLLSIKGGPGAAKVPVKCRVLEQIVSEKQDDHEQNQSHENKHPESRDGGEGRERSLQTNRELNT